MDMTSLGGRLVFGQTADALQIVSVSKNMLCDVVMFYIKLTKANMFALRKSTTKQVAQKAPIEVLVATDLTIE